MLASVLDSVRDLERIGDLAVASANLSQHIHNKGIEFSDTAKAELADVYNRTHRIALDSIRVVVDDDKVLAGQVILRHEELEKLENNCVKYIPNVLTMVSVLRKQVSTMLITSHITHVSQTMRLTLLKRLQKV